MHYSSPYDVFARFSVEKTKRSTAFLSTFSSSNNYETKLRKAPHTKPKPTIENQIVRFTLPL